MDDAAEEVELLIDDAEQRMHGAVEALDRQLAGFRTGRASTALVENITVEYYGTPTPLNQMSVLATPEPRLISIRPYDAKTIPLIEKAILGSDVGLTPSNNGQAVLLPIPELTAERRDELVRLVGSRVEEARVAIRNVRRDLMHELDKADLPEDDLHDAKERAQKITDEAIALAEQHGERKIAEVREV